MAESLSETDRRPASTDEVATRPEVPAQNFQRERHGRSDCSIFSSKVPSRRTTTAFESARTEPVSAAMATL